MQIMIQHASISENTHCVKFRALTLSSSDGFNATRYLHLITSIQKRTCLQSANMGALLILSYLLYTVYRGQRLVFLLSIPVCLRETNTGQGAQILHSWYSYPVSNPSDAPKACYVPATNPPPIDERPVNRT
jgi:hypothetical protein